MIEQEKIFTKDECDEIISFHKWAIYNSVVDNGDLKSNNIKYKGFTIPFNSKTLFFYKKLFKFFEDINQVTLYEFPLETYLMKYDINDVFGVHKDNEHGRIISVGVCLNDEYEGGEFILYPKDNEQITLKKETGNSYFFPCEVSHKVKKITKGTRWSIISFIRKKDYLNLKSKKTML
jgi:hypothetical protein